VAKLDFKRAPDGGLHLLEVNPRFTLWVNAGAAAGVNLPAIVHADLTGTARPPAARARPGVRWIWPSADAAAARERGIPLRSWLPWALRAETNSSFALRDPAPYVLGRLRRR
jgi:predicted ATP-grasp superfamily ATP-dependent carboligase